MRSEDDEEEFCPSSENEFSASVDEDSEEDEAKEKESFNGSDYEIQATSKRRSSRSNATEPAAKKPRSAKDLETITEQQQQEYNRREQCPETHIQDELDGEMDEDACRICYSDDAEPSNCIIFCDGCDFTAHQLCYAVDTIPEGDWFCRRCEFQQQHKDEPYPSGTYYCCAMNSSPRQEINGIPKDLTCDAQNEFEPFYTDPNFAVACKFFYRFGIPGLKMPPIGISELCRALLQPHDNTFLVDLHIRMLTKIDARGVR